MVSAFCTLLYGYKVQNQITKVGYVSPKGLPDIEMARFLGSTNPISCSHLVSKRGITPTPGLHWCYSRGVFIRHQIEENRLKSQKERLFCFIHCKIFYYGCALMNGQLHWKISFICCNAQTDPLDVSVTKETTQLSRL